jgi:hypothetical protein
MRGLMPETIAVMVLTVGAGCAKGGSSAAAQTGGSLPAALSASAGSACKQKLLTTDDAAGVLHAPSTVEEIPGDNGSTCRFTTASDASLSVTLRPGMGKASLAVWKSGKMPIGGVPEDGVGDEAVWVEELHEVVARKNDLLCDIQVMGLDRNAPGTSIADQRHGVDALCNKIFAKVR